MPHPPAFPVTQSNYTIWRIILISLVMGLVLRAIAITNKTSISHDEGISYLAATANQGAYQRVQENTAYPYGTWVTASKWRDFFTVRERFAFPQISRDLIESDIHPPLYFWLLHIWTIPFGVHAWTGPTLNLLFFVLSVIALYSLARTLLRNDREAALVTAIWAVSPALIETTLEARQYELLGLCTILFTWSLLRYIDTTLPHSWLRWAVLTIAVAAGALTHFHFALVVAGAIFVFLLPLYRSALSRFLAAMVALGVGYLLFLLLHPQFFHSVQSLASRQAEATHYYWTALDFMRRIYATAFTYTRFLVYGGILQIAVFCFATSFVIWAAWAFFRNHIGFLERIRQGNVTGIEGVFFFLWMAGATIFLYLTLISPINAMTPRHMSIVWPFAAFAPILLLRFVPKGRQLWQWLLVSVVFLSGVATVYFDYSGEEAVITFSQSDTVIIDTVHRGILPRIIMQLPDETQVFAADQAYLLAHPEAWLAQLNQESRYISDLSYNNNQMGQAQIIDLLGASLQVEVEKVPGKFNGGTVYQLEAQLP